MKDDLCIDGKCITSFEEQEVQCNCLYEHNGQTTYKLMLTVETGSEADKKIKKYLFNRNNYGLDVNLRERK